MKNVVALICIAGFAVLPLAVLGLRAAWPKRMPWWAVFSITVGLGWALALVGAMLREGPETGAGHVFALLFGWAFALIWFAPWLLVYAVIQFFRRRHASRNA
jgi:hypothetical protein